MAFEILLSINGHWNGKQVLKLTGRGIFQQAMSDDARVYFWRSISSYSLMVINFQPVYWCDDGGCWILGGWLRIGFAYQFPEWPNGAGSKMRVKNSMFWWRLDCSNIRQPYCWCLNEEFRLVWIIGRSMFNDKWYCFFDCLITFDYWVCLQIGYP